MRLTHMTAGIALLRSVAQGQSPPLTLTGTQVGSAAGFTPIGTETGATGLILDNSAHPETARQTLVSDHETIFSVHLDQHVQFDAIGNFMIFANGQPFVWLVSEIPLHKLQIDPTTRFAGDEYWLSGLLRWPYLRSLINYAPAAGFHAQMPRFPAMPALTVPEQTRPNQVQIDRNTLPLGGDRLVHAARCADLGWYGSPWTMRIDRDFGRLDGGRTKSGV